MSLLLIFRSTHKFLEQLQLVAVHHNFFKIGFTPQEMDELPDLYRAVINDPAFLHDSFLHAKGIIKWFCCLGLVLDHKIMWHGIMLNCFATKWIIAKWDATNNLTFDFSKQISLFEWIKTDYIICCFSDVSVESVLDNITSMEEFMTHTLALPKNEVEAFLHSSINVKGVGTLTLRGVLLVFCFLLTHHSAIYCHSEIRLTSDFSTHFFNRFCKTEAEFKMDMMAGSMFLYLTYFIDADSRFLSLIIYGALIFCTCF